MPPAAMAFFCSVIVHFRRNAESERARGLRPKLLAKVRRQHGTIRCEACGREERTTLGAAAESEFEAHRRDPLSTSEGIRQSRLAHFALLCASCHRLIHAVMRIESRTVNVEEFRARLERPIPATL